MNWQMVWQIYDYFLTKPTFPSDIVESMAPYLRFAMMRKFVLHSILYEFDISPMEKNRKTASLKHRINGKQKRTLARRLGR